MTPQSNLEKQVTSVSAVRLEGVFKAYTVRGSTFQVLRDVNLTIPIGSSVCILGASGSGKTTLLNLACGFDTPTSGDVSLFGLPVKKLHIPMNIGVVQQRDSLFPFLSAADNVAFGLFSEKTLEKSTQQAKAVAWLAKVGLGGFEKNWPRELSGGMRRRVELARALAHRPEVLFFDEPFSGLDSLIRLEMQDLLLQLRLEHPVSTFFATHDIEEAIYLSDEIYVLGGRPGQIVAHFDVDLPNARDQDVRFSTAFIQLRSEISDCLKAHSKHAEGVGR